MEIKKQKVNIIEDSYLAYIASKCINSNAAAIVVKNTIFIHNVTIDTFIKDRKWLLHELKHIEQYQQDGIVKFVFKYLIYSIKYGYKNNPYEMEARNSESDNTLLTKFDLSAYIG